ncbi:helix-turn-helix domain-containing protein [Bradyrhizobium sp. AUGA SZCCT0182]|uniref:helix-turn-helix domain-containing protein n=1 Tax=Bradyrhizobium sp. AUGA SZCCT0182 TaxID=2807667 RepID=UPI001BA4D9B5|nr:helix-turn-helix domain-containing protein [Bradyrhizobium sp. AUGA SZCCT0182]MBR1231257.1 helix-turn-helix domain-containing protein [Bradyrhizobium sp. AUGA SZCCT0182]
MMPPFTSRSYLDVDSFQADITSVCGHFNVSPASRSGQMKGRIALDRFCGVEIASIGLDADRVVRDQRDIRTDDADYFFLIIQSRGRVLMRQGGYRALLREGDMFLVDSAEPASFEFQGRYGEQISLHLPRDEVIRRFGDSVHGGIDLRREDALSLAMRSVLERMLDGQSGGSNRLAEAFFSVFGAFLFERRNGARPQIADDRSLIAAAVRAIDLYASDPEFGPKQLAGHLGVSLRKLQREFRQIEETPGRKLMSTRLARAHEALRRRSPASGPRTVSEIAYEQGFNDLSYFYREFRKRYGVAPGCAARPGGSAAD